MLPPLDHWELLFCTQTLTPRLQRSETDRNLRASNHHQLGGTKLWAFRISLTPDAAKCNTGSTKVWQHATLIDNNLTWKVQLSLKVKTPAFVQRERVWISERFSEESWIFILIKMSAYREHRNASLSSYQMQDFLKSFLLLRTNFWMSSLKKRKIFLVNLKTCRLAGLSWQRKGLIPFNFLLTILNHVLAPFFRQFSSKI